MVRFRALLQVSWGMWCDSRGHALYHGWYSVPPSVEGRGGGPWLGEELSTSQSCRAGLVGTPERLYKVISYEVIDCVLETRFIIAMACGPNPKLCRHPEEGEL